MLLGPRLGAGDQALVSTLPPSPAPRRAGAGLPYGGGCVPVTPGLAPACLPCEIAEFRGR